VRASSRLVLVWTSISLVAVAVGWSALDSAIGTGSPEQAEVAALDPSVLAPSPRFSASSTPTALPARLTASPSKAAVKRADRRTPPRTTPEPDRSASPRPAGPPPASPSPSHRRGDPRSNLPPGQDQPDEAVRDVATEGGSATVGYSDDQVYLLDYAPRPGFQVQGSRLAHDYIVVRFLARSHASTIYAFVDSAGAFRVKVVEENA
jgi:hypothetical protein